MIAYCLMLLEIPEKIAFVIPNTKLTPRKGLIEPKLLILLYDTHAGL